MTTPELHLEMAYVRDSRRRILTTREPGPSPGPLFEIVWSATACAHAVHAELPEDLAREVLRLAAEETPTSDPARPPRHADRYRELLGAHLCARFGASASTRVLAGPAFVFPAALVAPTDVVVIDDERSLDREFRGWTPGEIAAGRAPVMAVVVDERPVSVCFCARACERAAAAGVETAGAFRGRGFAGRVTTAWAVAIRATDRIPVYSTEWDNLASLAVARKLGLVTYAGTWSVGRG